MKRIIYAVLALSLLLTTLLFQNCGRKSELAYQLSFEQSLAEMDSVALPRLLADDSFIYRQTKDVIVKSTQDLYIESSSVILTLNSQAHGDVYRLYSNEESGEARISIESGNILRVSQFSTSQDYVFADVPLPTGADNETVTIAASFGTKPSEIQLLINGLRQDLKFQTVGTPFDSQYTKKTISLNATAGDILDIVIYSKVLLPLDLNTLSRWMAGGLQIQNVVFDPSLSDVAIGAPQTTATREFLAAKAIIDRSCTSCHDNGNVGDFRGLTEAQFISKGLVSPGNLGASKLYFRLSGSTQGPGPKTMPMNESALPSSDLDIIAAWIQSIH